jgi:isocitrate dehydrogenase kinase/phosphatase
LFNQEHGDLLQASTWQQLQDDAVQGRAPDVYPYRREIRFPR